MSGSAQPTPDGRTEAEKKYGPKLPTAITKAAAAVDAMYQPPQDPAQPVQPGGDGTQPGANSTSQPGAGQQPEPPAADRPLDWEQRAKSAEGRLEALMQREREANDRLEQLTRTVSEMQARGQPFQESQQPQPFERRRYLSEEEENDYGKDLIGVTKKAAREELEPEFFTMQQKIAQLEGRLNGTSQVIQRNEMASTWGYLAQHIPNWNEINHHPDFKERYLGERDVASGRRRAELIKEAFDTHDAGRVLHFFRDYLSEATGTPTRQQPSPQQPAQQSNGADPLLAYAAPGRARSEPQSALPPGKPTYTRAQMTAFWDDRRRGRWRGREADAEAIEQDIFRAQHEGRIVG